MPKWILDWCSAPMIMTVAAIGWMGGVVVVLLIDAVIAWTMRPTPSPPSSPKDPSNG